ncbi:MAG TPA: haloacid dehalogenase-like hydrolase [Rugosimonospora sp.]|nr:haloacid dehalogenase-like hydrolase [Rugosimonospora sp.]
MRTLVRDTPPRARIAVFDNDGTLWCERPSSVQALFLQARWREMAAVDPALAQREPFRSAAHADTGPLPDLLGDVRRFAAAVAAAYQGYTVQEFAASARHFLATAVHPDFDAPFTRLVYRPMAELMDLLRDNGFAVFITASVGRDLARAVVEEAFELPAHQVIGSAAALEYVGQTLRHRNRPSQTLDERSSRVVHIYERTGHLPAFAAGNADGDVEMLQAAQFGLLLHHDDDQREYAYHAGAEQARAVAAEAGWLEVSMRDDFAEVFDLEPARAVVASAR